MDQLPQSLRPYDPAFFGGLKMWIGYRKENQKLTFRALALSRSESDKGLLHLRNVSFRISLRSWLGYDDLTDVISYLFIHVVIFSFRNHFKWIIKAQLHVSECGFCGMKRLRVVCTHTTSSEWDASLGRSSHRFVSLPYSDKLNRLLLGPKQSISS